MTVSEKNVIIEGERRPGKMPAPAPEVKPGQGPHGESKEQALPPAPPGPGRGRGLPGLERWLETQPWNVALVTWLLAAQIFARSCDPRWLSLAPALMLGGALLLPRRTAFETRDYRPRWLILALILLSFSFRWNYEIEEQLRFYQSFQATASTRHPMEKRPASFTAELDEDFRFRVQPRLNDDPSAVVSLPFRTSEGLRISVFCKMEDYLAWPRGSALRLQGDLQPLRPAPNPWSYEPHIMGAGQGVYLQLDLKRWEPAGPEKHAGRKLWYERSRACRDAFYRLGRHALTPDEAGLFLAVWTGDQRYCSRAIIEAMDCLGVGFLLRPSGQVLSLAYFLLPHFTRGTKRRSRQLLRFFILLVASLLLGLSMPLVKLCLIQAIAAWKRIRRKSYSELQTQGLAGFLMLVCYPGLAVHTGFLLSLMAGMLYQMIQHHLELEKILGQQTKKRLSRRAWQRKNRRERRLTGLAFQWLLSWLLRLLGISNRRVTFLSHLVYPHLKALSPLYLMGRALGLGEQTGRRLAGRLSALAMRASQFEYRLMRFDPLRYGILFFILIYGSLRVLMLRQKRPYQKSRLFYGSVCLALAGLLIRHLFLWPPGLQARVTVFSVGAADMIYLELPDTNLLIDTGERSSHVKTLDASLRQGRFPGLDLVILTHEDQDHTGGLEELLGRVPVKKILSPVKRDLSLGPYESRRHEVQAPIHLKQGDLELRLLPAAEEARLSENDRSLVLEVSIGERRMLFAGDVEAPREAMLLAELRPVDLLKVPHHGSRSSSTAPFLELLRPELAAISTGPKHGHPHAEVLERYEAMGIEVQRTDRDGALHYELREGGFCVVKRYNRSNREGFLSSKIAPGR